MENKEDTTRPQRAQNYVSPESRLKELSVAASEFKVDFGIPARRYYRSGDEMLKMAHVYNEERNYERAYMLFMKFMTLFLEKIREHPDLKAVSSTVINANTKQLKEVIPIAEELKSKLLNIYQKEYEKELQKRKKEQLEITRKRSREEDTDNARSLIILNNRNSNEKDASAINSVPASNIKHVPHLPDENLLYSMDMDTKKPLINQNPKPNIDRSTKPEMSYNSLETFSYLRLVIIPSNMMPLFLVLAERNTELDIETCGILAGKLKQNRLVITHLLIPKQNGTSNSCSTINEEDLFTYQDENRLITLGWIHTHPSQTAFLSSVDKHTQLSYQLLMPEAIAVVCAPKYSETGYFSLTKYGLEYISNCKKSDFHPHDASDAELCQIPDHYQLDHTASVEIVDLRN